MMAHLGLRTKAALAGIALVVIAGLGVGLHGLLAGGGPAVKLQGMDLQGAPAPDIHLVDQNGTPIALSHLRGHPVVVAFVFTHCTTVCPLTAEKLRSAASMLGGQAERVDWLAVSLDPLGDSPASAQAFVAAHHLTGRLHYLLGTSAQLTPVWNAYFIAVQSQLDTQTGTETIMHSVGLFVIDGQGHERVYLDDSYGPVTLAADLHALLGSSH